MCYFFPNAQNKNIRQIKQRIVSPFMYAFIYGRSVQWQNADKVTKYSILMHFVDYKKRDDSMFGHKIPTQNHNGQW